MIYAKGISTVLPGYIDESSESTTKSSTEDHKRQASNILVVALSDQSIWVVQIYIGNPKDIMEKLDTRYDSKSTASKIEKVSEIAS